jgi:hypothetical protein
MARTSTKAALMSSIEAANNNVNSITLKQHKIDEKVGHKRSVSDGNTIF